MDWRDLLERPGEVELQGFAQPGSFPIVFHFHTSFSLEPSVLVKGTMRNMEGNCSKQESRMVTPFYFFFIVLGVTSELIED